MTWVPLGLGAVLLAGFVAIERSLISEPLLPLRLFSSRSVSGASIATLLTGAASAASDWAPSSAH